MQAIEQTSIDQLLGPAEDRYFGAGFRGFNTTIKSYECSAMQFHGEVLIEYIGPVRPRGELPHLGSIEILAIALQLATFGLNRLGKIGVEDTNRSFLRYYTVQIKQSLPAGKYPYSCLLRSSSQDGKSLQGSTTVLEITIGSVRVHLELDHRGGSRFRKLPAKEIIPVMVDQLHSKGYKCTSLTISNVVLHPEKQYVSADIVHELLIEESKFQGIGSARYGLLPTDALRIIGQLMQALLYKMDRTDRLRCSNIWLRKMDLHMERPYFATEARAQVKFNYIRKIAKGDEQWKLIKLQGQVGNFVGNFEAAYCINKE